MGDRGALVSDKSVVDVPVVRLAIFHPALQIDPADDLAGARQWICPVPAGPEYFKDVEIVRVGQTCESFR